MPERVIVTGGRDYGDRAHVYAVLNALLASNGIELLVEGGAEGADTLARDWAKARGVPVETVEANWDRHGNRAGPIRNSEMLRHNPSLVIAFSGGQGAADMVAKAQRAGVECWVIDPPQAVLFRDWCHPAERSDGGPPTPEAP